MRLLYHYGLMSLSYNPVVPFEGSVLLVRAGGPAGRPDRGWGAFVSGRVVVKDVETNHVGLAKEPAIRLVAAEVARAIEEALAPGAASI